MFFKKIHASLIRIASALESHERVVTKEDLEELEKRITSNSSAHLAHILAEVRRVEKSILSISPEKQALLDELKASADLLILKAKSLQTKK